MNDKSVSELYHDHVMELERRAEAGDEFALKSLCCLAIAIISTTSSRRQMQRRSRV